MLKKDDKAILQNRGTKEFATILKKWRRKDVFYFNVNTERGIVFENITTNCEFPCYINEELSIKYNQK